MQPILLSPISTDTLDEKTWLEWREHGDMLGRDTLGHWDSRGTPFSYSRENKAV